MNKAVPAARRDDGRADDGEEAGGRERRVRHPLHRPFVRVRYLQSAPAARQPRRGTAAPPLVSLRRRVIPEGRVRFCFASPAARAVKRNHT